MTVDVLAELNAGSRTLQEVERLFDSIMKTKDASRVAELLGLSGQEWTAYCHGVWFDELADWRQNGWPSTCGKCGTTVHVNEYGWLAVEDGDGHVLIHLECPGQNGGTGQD